MLSSKREKRKTTMLIRKILARDNPKYLELFDRFREDDEDDDQHKVNWQLDGF